LLDFSRRLQRDATDTPGEDRLAHVHSPIVRRAKLLAEILGNLAAKVCRSQIQRRIVRFDGLWTVAIVSLAVPNCQTGLGCAGWRFETAIRLDLLNVLISQISDSF
jgi:hypothetical protein